MSEDGQRRGMYDSRFEHDACGVGFVVRMDGRAEHAIVEKGVLVLQNLIHRGAAGADGKTGDGAGLLVQIPHEFLKRECRSARIALPDAGDYAVAMCFLPVDEAARAACRDLIGNVLEGEGLKLLGWRDVPVTPAALGDIARKACPFISQAFIECREGSSEEKERHLFVARRQIEQRIENEAALRDNSYVVSMSTRTVVYKGMMMGNQLSGFYKDLAAPDFVSALAVVHQRYSTNTFPSWRLAQPFRYLAHNGEINTLRGNRMQMEAREKRLVSRVLGNDLKKVLPLLDDRSSDSACLDCMLELLVAGGREMPLSMMMLIPQAWGPKYPIGPDLRGFFEYYSGLMEPWDGPAAVAFTDGVRVGALSDRNGLRPARYTIAKDGFMVLASEAGVLDMPPDEVAEKGSLRPGEMILVDLSCGRVMRDAEIKSHYARKQPYRRWVEENKVQLHGLFNDIAPVVPDEARLLSRQRLFGYTREDINLIISPMASTGHEPVGSMGNDSPLAVLSEKPQLLYSYFKQMFAQVTNPPIDPVREELVMSLMTYMGNPADILTDDPKHARLIKLPHPIISNEDLYRIKSLNLRHFSSTVVPMGFAAEGGPHALEEALEQLCGQALQVAADRRSIIVLSDKDMPEHLAPMPALLAVSAVNQRLRAKGLRTGVGLIVETGEAREVHHMAVLLGYGATAVNPYLAFETVADLASRHLLEKDMDVTRALENYITALTKGILKVMSKMGISTLRSYRGAQVFEAIGLSEDVTEKYFTGTESRIGGIDLEGICREAVARFRAARSADGDRTPLPSGGHYRLRVDGERHLWTPESISRLQLATRRNDTSLYREYARLINDQSRQQSTLRGLFKFRKTGSIPVDRVEPAEAIMKRFVTGAMSFGSISREAHETLAVAMNRIGAMSNSGEGGEDPARYKPLPSGDSRCSAVKQVASGRFGVTIEYLVNARELQIKVSQGAKPGEGGQLPGHKVNEEIARVRHSTPGVTLISPPPHHDIYSIEDLKQLIFDLKNANPSARISVKLVSEVGVGTVAAGVAKAKADMVLISGYDGGTGAAPLSSIKHAGVPWELGLAETQQTLMRNDLRRYIRVQCDGQIKTGRDVAIAAMLGAEEFGFATAPLVVCGCVMLRKCHENTCPMGVATQNPELRRRFAGKPEYVVNFFRMVAEEVRGIMAELGVEKIDDLVGRADLLDVSGAVEFWKTRGLDFSRILEGGKDLPGAKRCTESQKHEIADVLDRELIEEAKQAVGGGKPVVVEKVVRNVNRAVGTMLSGEIARKYGLRGLEDDSVVCRLKGSAGQSFGAFAVRGVTLLLEGETNDYMGKGLSGGRLVVRPPAGAKYAADRNVIAGNVALYGATSGEAFVRGSAGERFAVRNSGAIAVVEGVGDHGCEYMTGGVVVILGSTGVNFAAGMSGGIAYVYDPTNAFDRQCNLELVDLELVRDDQDARVLKNLVSKHVQWTDSPKGRAILDDWDACLPSFVKVFPTEYRLALGKMSKEDEAIEREEKVND